MDLSAISYSLQQRNLTVDLKYLELVEGYTGLISKLEYPVQRRVLFQFIRPTKEQIRNNYEKFMA